MFLSKRRDNTQGVLRRKSPDGWNDEEIFQKATELELGLKEEYNSDKRKGQACHDRGVQPMAQDGYGCGYGPTQNYKFT